ncbi:MAG TPA: DinB family protein [Thermoanaerobaculia bacterium]|nr:DinB family protein [Thermoanaerobaculia bacterium]
MRTFLALLLAASPLLAIPDPKPTPPPATLKSILLEQFQTTHANQDWFVPASKAVEGLTADQAAWKDGNANHSIAQLVSHLIFWDTEQLARLQGKPVPPYSGKNDDTFNASLNKASWDQMVKDLDRILTDWEKAIASADDATIQKWASSIAHVSAHNAYHTGQILYIRKQQGSWDPEKGVK